MAKNNFKAKEVASGSYAGDVGSIGQNALNTGLGQQQQGYANLQDTFQQQKSFAQMLQDAAAGRGGPSMADQQILDATARNNANAAGFAASAKGLNPALAARQALMAQAGNNQQAAGQAAQTRVQEQLGARAQLGGALAGEAGTAGGQTSAGQGLAATGGGLANQSNANLINSRQGANAINADVSKQNAGIINGMVGGVLNAAGGALGLAEGGEVPGTENDEAQMAMAAGGRVPAAPHLPTAVPHVAAPKRSFAAQVAHHLAREYFAEGGEVTHEPYHFAAVDVRRKENGAKVGPQHVNVREAPTGAPTVSKEGTDSEGKVKRLRLADGGEVKEEPYETSTEQRLRERDERRQRMRDEQTQRDMDSLAGASKEQQDKHAQETRKAPPGHYSEGGWAGGDSDVEDNEPDVDSAIDPDEGEEYGMYAEGGEADESAGLDTSRDAVNGAVAHRNDVEHPAVKAVPSGFQRAGAAMSAFGSAMGGGPAAFRLADLKPIPTSGISKMDPHLESATGKRLRTGGPRQLSTETPVREPGGAVAPIVPKPQPPAVATFRTGGPVPGKANVKGDSLENDTVPAKLSPGEVVLPRTISHDPKKAKRFVELLQQGHNGHSALAAIKGKRS